MNLKTNEKLGIGIVLFCGTVWGLSGVLGQLLFQSSDVPVGWLSSFRMFFSGICILLLLIIKKDQALFKVWKNKKNILSLFIFSILGLMAVQYTYFAAVATSNAATATVLQYTYPVLMLLYTAISTHKFPSVYEILAILFAFLGVVLISTHGNIHSLSISKIALFWGLLSAFSFVFYTVYPQKLFQQIGIMPIMGWAFVIGGVILSILTKSYQVDISFSVSSVTLIMLITIVGTLIPFLTYGKGVQILGNVKASLFVTVEPVMSAILAFFLVKQKFTAIDILGFLCIIGAVQFVAFRTLHGKKNS